MTLSDIKNRVYMLAKTNSTDYPAADMLISVNAAMNRIASLIIQADGRWQWDDTNQSDLPIATAAIVSAPQDYQISTSHLQIERVEIQDSNGTWRTLKPRDAVDYGDTPQSWLSTQSGTPMEYDKRGVSLFLYPVPDYSASSALKVFFKRGPYAFTSSDLSTGTMSPGFSSLYHDLVALWAAYDKTLVDLPNVAANLLNEINRKEAAMIADYGRRDKDDRPQITMRPIRFR